MTSGKFTRWDVGLRCSIPLSMGDLLATMFRDRWGAVAGQLASVTAERDALRRLVKPAQELRVVLSCIDLVGPAVDSFKDAVDALVTDAPAAEREAPADGCASCGKGPNDPEHVSLEQDWSHDFEPAVAMANEAIRKENAIGSGYCDACGNSMPECKCAYKSPPAMAGDRVAPDSIYDAGVAGGELDERITHVRRERLDAANAICRARLETIRDLESRLAAALAERDAAVESAKSAVREFADDLRGIADRVQRGEVNP